MKQFLQYQQNELTHQKNTAYKRFWNNPHREHSSQKIVIKKNWNIWDQETTVSSQCSQPWLTSPIHEGGDTYFWYVRRVWRYQRGIQNPHIEKGRTSKWPEEKEKATIYKNRHLYQLFLYLMHDNMKWVQWVDTYLFSIE